MSRWVVVVAVLAVGACAPQVVGQQVGQSLYNASVTTGDALATLGDRTGLALQTAGTTLRRTTSPLPEAPPGAPPSIDDPGSAAPQIPVQSQPLE